MSAAAKKRAIAGMAAANLNAFIEPYLNSINEYGDNHPIFDEAFILQPQVIEAGLTSGQDADPFPYHFRAVLISEDADPETVELMGKVFVRVRPLTRKGQLEAACSECHLGPEEMCFHILAALWRWKKDVKKEVG